MSTPFNEPLVFLWEHLGPLHHDRLQAVCGAGNEVFAIELFGRSRDYVWENDGETAGFHRVTLASERREVGTLRLALRIVRAVLASKARVLFFCHYNEASVFLAACALRLAGRRIVTMIDSKADDRPRSRYSRLASRIALLPYSAALVAGPRSREYVAGLGIAAWRTQPHYNTLSVRNLRSLAGGGNLPAFADRPFLIVARLIPEKNLGTALEAYAHYRSGAQRARKLVVIGEGPEGEALRKKAQELGIADHVEWRGRQGRVAVAGAMHSSLALLLSSTSETYGIVVIEALAQGLVPIVSANAGAVDVLVDHAMNGFVIDPRDPQDMLEAMIALDRDEAMWRRMSAAALAASERGDVRHFVRSVEILAGRKE